MARASRAQAASKGKPVVPQHMVPNLFLWGIGGLVLSLVIVFVFPDVRPIQVASLAILHGLSGAAIATAITGILQLKTRSVVASGPFVVFVLAFWAIMSAGAPETLANFSSLLLGRGTRKSP
jgi:hypothetical protein